MKVITILINLSHGVSILAKSSREQIDADEKRILQRLEHNSKESIDKIAKKCGFSRQKVWRIIKRLEKNKTIWGYGAITDDEKQDMTHFTMLVKRSTQPLTKELGDTIIKRQLEGMGKSHGVIVECSYYTHGKYDWIVTFKANDIRIAKKFGEQFSKLYKDYISELELIETLFFIRKHGVLNPNKDEFRQFIG